MPTRNGRNALAFTDARPAAAPQPAARARPPSRSRPTAPAWPAATAAATCGTCSRRRDARPDPAVDPQSDVLPAADGGRPGRRSPRTASPRSATSESAAGSGSVDRARSATVELRIGGSPRYAIRPPNCDLAHSAVLAHPPLSLVALHLMMTRGIWPSPARPERRAGSVRRPAPWPPPRSEVLAVIPFVQQMLLLAQDAAARCPADARPRAIEHSVRMMLPLLAILVLFYFLMIRPQKKKDEEFRKMVCRPEGQRPRGHDRRHSRRGDQRPARRRASDGPRRRRDGHEDPRQHLGDRPRGDRTTIQKGGSTGGKSSNSTIDVPPATRCMAAGGRPIGARTRS